MLTRCKLFGKQTELKSGGGAVKNSSKDDAEVVSQRL